jgi:hypothetical protein
MWAHQEKVISAQGLVGQQVGNLREVGDEVDIAWKLSGSGEITRVHGNGTHYDVKWDRGQLYEKVPAKEVRLMKWPKYWARHRDDDNQFAEELQVRAAVEFAKRPFFVFTAHSPNPHIVRLPTTPNDEEPIYLLHIEGGAETLTSGCQLDFNHYDPLVMTYFRTWRTRVHALYTSHLDLLHQLPSISLYPMPWLTLRVTDGLTGVLYYWVRVYTDRVEARCQADKPRCQGGGRGERRGGERGK